MNQEDFRKLLATPRPQSDVSQTPKATIPATPRGTAKKDGGFVKPALPQKKKWKKPEPREDRPEPSTKYRDRAKERREGVEAGPTDAEQITKVLSASAQLAQAAVPTVDTAAISYEQSKYLGGDEEHTHLVKGLDFALLKKVRNDLKTQESEDAKDKEAADYVASLLGSGPVTFSTKMGESVYNIMTSIGKEQPPVRNEIFVEGRMAWVWDLGHVDEFGEYVGGDDFPTMVMRSKAELRNYDAALTVSSNDLVIEKVSTVMASLRHGSRGTEPGTGEKKRVKRKDKEKALAEVEQNVKEEIVRENLAAEADDDDIFADAGRDYELEVQGRKIKPLENVDVGTGAGVDGEEADEMDVDDPAATGSLQNLLQQSQYMLDALQGSGSAAKIVGNLARAPEKDNSVEPASSTKATPQTSLPRPTQSHNIDLDVADLDSGSDADGDDADLSQMDMGTKGNKRRQLSRFDFEEEEDFRQYKESQVHMPKAAFSFGAKAEDAPKRKKDPKNKFNKEFQQLDRVFSEKYGKNLGGGKGKREGDGGGGGGSGKKQKR